MSTKWAACQRSCCRLKAELEIKFYNPSLTWANIFYVAFHLCLWNTNYTFNTSPKPIKLVPIPQPFCSEREIEIQITGERCKRSFHGGYNTVGKRTWKEICSAVGCFYFWLSSGQICSSLGSSKGTVEPFCSIAKSESTWCLEDRMAGEDTSWSRKQKWRAYWCPVKRLRWMCSYADSPSSSI